MQKNILNKIRIIFLLYFFPILAISQEVLWYDNFESYTNNYDVITNTPGLQGWGANGTGTTTLDSGQGSGSSDSYYQSPTGSSTFQYVITPTTGVTYNFYASIAMTTYINGAIKMQIISLNGSGNGDNVTVQDISYDNYNGTGNQLNTWKEMTASYTTDGTETGDIAFRITKGWGGSGERIDDIRVVCVSCAKKSYASGNWSSVATWGGEVAPTSSQNVTVSHDLVVDASTNTLGSVTVDASKTLTINDGQTLTASGATEINGTLSIAGTGKYDANSSFDASSANVTFTGDGRLECSSTVTSLGTLTTSSGTVEYDGGTQSVLDDTYYNLEIDQSGTKSSAGNITVNGNLLLTGGELDFNGGNNINLKGNLSKTSGALVNSSSTNGYLDLKGTTGTQTIDAIDDGEISIKVSDDANVTVNGNISANYVWLQSSNTGTFLIGGWAVTLDDKIVVDGGTLQITSGSLNTSKNSSSSHELDGGTIDIDGGTVNIGYATNNTADLNITSGTIDISGGTLNVSDCIDMSNGTFTQTGGTVNVRNYNSSGEGDADHKFDVDGGTLNLTAGTLNINGEHSNTTYHSISIDASATVNSNANHTLAIIDNTSAASVENRYLDLQGHSLGSLTFNVSSSKYYYLNANQTLLGDLTVTTGGFRSNEYNVDVAGAADIDGTLRISTGNVDVNGSFDGTNGEIDFTDASAGKLLLAGTVSSLGTLDATTGTVVYDGSSQNVLSDDYNNLEIDQSGNKTAQGAINIAGTLTVQSGATFDLAVTTATITGSSDINGAINASTGIFDANGSFDATGGSITFTGAGNLRIAGSVTSLGTLGTSAGTVEYDGADQTVFSDTYYNLLLSGSGTPAAGGDITCNGTFTLQSSTTKYNLSSYTHQTIGASDINEEMEISTGTYDADGDFDATDGEIDFTGNGRLQLAGTVTSLATLSTDNGTVEYDGGTQSVLADTYYNLEIDQSGNKTTAGTVSTEGDITISGGTLDINGNSLYCAGNFSNAGSLISPSTATFYLDGNGTNTNFGAFSDTDINIRKSGSSNITTTGNIDCRGFALTSGSSNSFIIDGETITASEYVSVEGGTLQITSGSFTATKNTGSTNLYTGFNLNGGTIDVDGGTLSFGEQSDQTADLNINGGTLDVSGGILNVSDAMDITTGTVTQSGGTINIRNYNSTGNTSEHKFEMDAGTLNLTAGTMNINGESGNSTQYSYSVASGVTVNANANHTIDILDNTSGTSSENRYIDMGGNNIGSLSYNVTSKNLFFVGNQELLGALTITDGTLKSDDAAEKITVASISQSGGFIDISNGEIECTGKADIDGKLTMSGGTFDVNGELELSSSTTESISDGYIYVTGDFDGANGNNFTPTGGTVTLDGTSDAGLSMHSSANFWDLIIHNSSYDVDASTNIEVDNDFVISSGELDMGSNHLYVKGDISNSGTLTTTNSSLTMNGSSAQTISSVINATDMVITNTSGVTANANVTLSGNLTLSASCNYNIGTTTTTVAGSSDINGTLTISTGTYDANGTYDATSGNTTISGAGRLQLASTVTSLGTASLNSASTVEYDGAGTQTIDDLSAKSSYGNVEIEGGLKNMEGGTTVSNKLTWGGDADMATNGHTLTLTGGQPENFGGSNSEGWGNPDNDRVIHKGTGSDVTIAYTSTTDEFFLPIGDDGSQRTISINPTAGLVWTVKYITGTPHSGGLDWASYSTGAPIESGSVSHVNNHYYYDIEPASSTTATLKLGMVGLSQTPASNSETFLMRYDNESGDGDAASNVWESTSASPSRGGSSEADRYVSASVSNFSPFSQGSSGDALPIDLVSFTGKCNNTETELEFVVASQINNDYFTIETSADNQNWTTIGEIPGIGNTSTQMTYNYTDYSPMQGLSYYRLTQTDYDGKSETFAPITVTCEVDAIGGYAAYPNPVKDELMIDIELDTYQGDDIQLQLIDINGKVAKQEQVELERGFNHLSVELNELPNGIYLLQFTGTKNHIKERRIIKQ